MITKLSNIVIQGILCTLFLLPNILEVISTEIEGSTISKDETCDTKGNVEKEILSCDSISGDSMSQDKKLEKWMNDLRQKLLYGSNGISTGNQMKRNEDTSTRPSRECFKKNSITSVSLKNYQGKFQELWNVKTAKNELETLSKLLIDMKSTRNSTASMKLILEDGKAIESNNVDENFSANGPGVLYLTLEDDELLLTNIAENITLHGEFVNGCLNGFVYGIAHWWKFPTELDSENNDKEYIDDNPMYKVLNFVGQYEYGKLVGPVWKPVYSLDEVPIGYYYSNINDKEANVNLKGTKNDLFSLRNRKSLFIYPDFTTAISGEFLNNGVLISGRVAKIKSISYFNKTSIMGLEISDRSDRVMNSDISTDSNFSQYPLRRDPYESQFVDISTSEIPNAGEGVFLKRNVIKGTVIAYFNGIRIKKNSAFSWNPFKKKSVFLIDFQNDKGDDIFLDIPEKFTMSSQYNATSGHKINHSNNPNSAYTYCRHPIYGKIICCYALQDMIAGTELTVKYSVTVNSDGMKSALKTALHFGHLVSGKSKDKFINDVKPYLDIVSKVAAKLDNIDLVRF